MGRLEFFDATHSFPGALQLTGSSCHPGFHVDGRNGSGQEVPTGVCFCRLESPDTRTRLKLVRVGP